MKHSAIILISSITLALSLASCSGKRESKNSAIRNFAVDETIKSASASFRANETIGGDSVWAVVSTSLTWPEKLGEYSISTLQDSIISRMYGVVPDGKEKSKANIDNAMMAFIGTPGDLLEGKYTPVDSVPDNSLFTGTLDVTGSVLYLNENFLSYQVTTYLYSPGAAHGSSVQKPFTYDLAAGRILGFNDIFKAGNVAKVLKVAESALREQVPADELEMYYLPLTTPGRVYLSDGMVVMHYDEYDIAPYAVGPVDINIWSYLLDDLLTPRAKALLSD